MKAFCCALVILGVAKLAPQARCADDDGERIRVLEDKMKTLFRQVMMQQFYNEEIARNQANSGLTRQRNLEHGPRSYHSSSHIGENYLSMHNHANFIKTIGLGELAMQMNGVNFRTRHNDYFLVKKSESSKEYGATEPIEFPDVPPTVKPGMSIEAQIKEMQKWFKAWADQDKSELDYRPYFKPVLCYMEGTWTISDETAIDEPFESDRHFLDASSWLDMQDKIRFTSYSATKDEFENYAYLPTTVYKMTDNGTTPVMAQWNYRVLCHPLKKDLPLNRIKPIDDLKTRLYLDRTYSNYLDSRATRYQIAPENKDVSEDRPYEYTYLDDLMHEIPGADNYPGKIKDDLYGNTVYPYDQKKKNPLNVAYYNRVYHVKTTDALGKQMRRRGFADENLFVAATTQENIPGLSFTRCNPSGKVCDTWAQKWTYAVPLEIIYLTPLAKWNPNKMEFKGDEKSAEGQMVYGSKKVKRNGKDSVSRAYNGTNSAVFYQTPVEFFQGEVGSSSADTTGDYKTFLDPTNPKKTIKLKASGVRIHLPNIPGVGVLRQRYPIVPVSGEGLGVWKELDALKEMVLFPTKNQKLFRDELYTTQPNTLKG